MYIDETLHNGAPADRESRSAVERGCYDFLERLGVEYSRVDHDETDTIEKCLEIEKVIGVGICKNLFLCNRQKTDFYLLMMDGHKPFRTAEVSKKLGTSRLSFGTAEDMLALLGVTPGSVSVLALMNDQNRRVSLVIDKDVVSADHIRCHPCRNTSTLKIRTADLLGRILPALHRNPTVISIEGSDTNDSPQG